MIKVVDARIETGMIMTTEINAARAVVNTPEVADGETITTELMRGTIVAEIVQLMGIKNTDTTGKAVFSTHTVGILMQMKQEIFLMRRHTDQTRFTKTCTRIVLKQMGEETIMEEDADPKAVEAEGVVAEMDQVIKVEEVIKVDVLIKVDVVVAEGGIKIKGIKTRATSRGIIITTIIINNKDIITTTITTMDQEGGTSKVLLQDESRVEGGTNLFPRMEANQWMDTTLIIPNRSPQ